MNRRRKYTQNRTILYLSSLDFQEQSLKSNRWKVVFFKYFNDMRSRKEILLLLPLLGFFPSSLIDFHQSKH